MSAGTRHASTRTPVASTLSPWSVRGALGLDALVTGGNGLAYVVFPGPLGELLGIGRTALLGLGLFLVGYALAVGVLAARRSPHRLAVLTVAGLNIVWTVLSLVALTVGPEPTVAGTVWIPAQAAVVALFAVLQLTALRRNGNRTEVP
ncbi:hypothetical protein [Kitasatospora sp. SUK 42]|uniref:hypothetical protein n=1 Tax=Kitasatospora sp. SUK 42 TaxID=1588882 RepID=UPI0018CAAB52|nr:hypothetical protein [Kitasatospora sp. SUK 42]MBV2153799.1 hypothetical protein [Kitasatospora sp. SUK 42]